jgi:hypothetical protein
MVIESVGAEFCPYHLKLVDEHGAETLKNGGLPKRRTLRVAAEPEPPVAEPVAVSVATVSADPATVRPRLAAAAAENLEQLQASLLEAAGSAVKPVWLTVECSGCGERSRVEAPVPDVRARVAAIELLLREGLGRAPQAEEPINSRMPQSIEAVQKLSWEQMQQVFAATFVDELAALDRDGGGALVREKIAALSEGERRVLWEALEELQPV